MNSPKITEAKAIRDAALRVLCREGQPATSGGTRQFRTTIAEIAGLMIAYNTPFTALPAPSETMRQALSAAGRTPLPYTLNIWHNRTKTFLVSWNDDEFRVTTFKRGAWAADLQRAALEPT